MDYVLFIPQLLILLIKHNSHVDINFDWVLNVLKLLWYLSKKWVKYIQKCHESRDLGNIV